LISTLLGVAAGETGVQVMANRGKLAAIGLLWLAAVVSQAQAADVNMVSSQAGLQAALGGAPLVTETFEDGHADGLVITAFGGSHVVGFQGQNFLHAGVFDASFVQSIGGTGGSAQYLDSVSTSGNQETVWFLGPGRQGVGAEWDLGAWGVGESLKLYAVFSDGEQLISEINPTTLGGQARGYLGFTSSQSFSAVIIRGALGPGANAETYAVDNVAFGNAAPVPEPETAAMWLMGLAGLSGLQRWRAQHRAVVRADKS